MSQLTDRLNTLIDEVSIDIVVATKYANADQMVELSAHPHPIIFGENRLQQAIQNQAACPDNDKAWHFIGHLQRKKTKKVFQNSQKTFFKKFRA